MDSALSTCSMVRRVSHWALIVDSGLEFVLKSRLDLDIFPSEFHGQVICFRCLLVLLMLLFGFDIVHLFIHAK